MNGTHISKKNRSKGKPHIYFYKAAGWWVYDFDGLNYDGESKLFCAEMDKARTIEGK